MLNGNEVQEYTNIGAVTNHFVFNLLPTFHTPFDEYLRGKHEATRRKITKFFRVVGKSRTKTTKSKCRAHDNRIPNLFRRSKSRVDRGHCRGLGNWDVDL